MLRFSAVSILTLLVADVGLAKAPRTPRLEKVQGQVELIRRNRVIPVKSEIRLKSGDVLRTGRSSRVRIVGKSGYVELAEGSSARLKGVHPKKKTIENIHLIYGHFHVEFMKSPSMQFTLPGTGLKSAKGDFFVHIFRSQTEFSKSIAGLYPEPPSLAEALSLGANASTFTQISCLSGTVKIKPSKGAGVDVVQGEVMRVMGGISDNVSQRVGNDEIIASVRTLGF